MKIYGVIVAALLFSVGCKGAHMAQQREELYKKVNSYDKVDKTYNLISQDFIFQGYTANSTKLFTRDIGKQALSLFITRPSQHSPHAVYSVRTELTGPHGSKMIQIWTDKFVQGHIDEEQSKLDAFNIEASVQPASSPAVQEAAEALLAVKKSAPLLTTKHVVAGTFLATIALVYRYREPIKKTLAQLLQGAQKVKVLAH